MPERILILTAEIDAGDACELISLVVIDPVRFGIDFRELDRTVGETRFATDAARPQGTEQTDAAGNLPDSPSAAQSDSQTQPADQKGSAASQEPRGTAAAQAARTHGGAASKPAGAAIAPAKQRRTRSLLIKLGIIAGAGAALGTVYGLSKGSPSRPPGAR